jgi:plasmid replication initiation protein
MSEKAAEIKENLAGNFTSISLPAHSRLVSLILSQMI